MYRIRVALDSSAVSGGPWLSTFYFSGAGIQSDAQSAATAVGQFWESVETFLHTSVTWGVEPAVAQLTDDGVITTVWSVTGDTGAGLSGANQILPPATQMLASLRTGVYTGGREIRGRLFIPGFTEAANGQGIVDGTIRGQVQTAATTLANVTAPNPWVVWSRTYAQTADVSAAQVSSSWSVLRSRKD